MAGSDAADRSASPVAVRQRLLHASRNNATVWYFEVHLGGSSLEQAAQQLPPGRPHLRAARQLLCQRLNVAGASLAWPRPGLLGVHLLVPEDSTEAPAGSTWSHWLVRSHLRGDLADAAKALLRTAPKGFDTLEVENVTAPSPVKDFWVDASEEVLDLGLELTGASLQEASISKSVTNGFVWNHGLQARDLLVWIDGRPSTEMSPEELAAELRSVRPLRLGFVRPGASVVQSPIVRSPGSISDVNEQVDQEIQELRGRRKHLQQLQQKLLEAQAQQLKSRALPGGTAGVGAANPAAGSAGATAEAVTGPGAMLRSGALPGGTVGVGAANPAAGSAGATAEAVTGPGAELLEEAAEAAAARAREEAAPELWNLGSEEQLLVKEAAQARLEASVAPSSGVGAGRRGGAARVGTVVEQRHEESVAEAVREQAERLHLEDRSPPRERGAQQVIQPPAVRSASAATPIPCGSARGLSVVSTPASHAGVSALPMSGALPGGTAGVGAGDPAAGSAGATAEAVTGPGAMLRSGALPGGTAGVGAADSAAGSAGATAEAVTGPGAMLRSGALPVGAADPAAGSAGVTAEAVTGPGAMLKSGALPGGTAGVGAANPAAGSAGATAEAVTGPGAMLRSGALPGGTAGVGAADPAAGSAGATAEAVTGPGAELLEEAAEAAAARAREEAAAELWNLRSEEQLVVKEAEEAAAQARLEASVAPALAWARAEEEVLQELERLQLEQRREESVAEAVREQAERLHLEESLVVRKQEEADHAREEAKKDGAKARHEAREALDAELEQLRLERGEALLASEEAKEALEMAEAKEKVTTECEEAAAKEVKNWEVLEQREKEMLQVAEVRERELEAEAVVKYEQREKELLFPALATARAEREEAAAARSHARDYAMQEVASELEKLRHGQSEAQVARSEAQLARAEVIKQEGEIRRMEDEAAQEVLKWENAVAIKERDALSRYAEKEQQLLGESKAEQQVAASLRLRELALRTGEEDLMATLRKRDHAILKQEKKVEEMEMSAEAMAERARDRAEDLAESLQERAKALALTAEARETKLQQREEELNSMVADQLRAMEDLQKLRSEFHAAETAAVIFEADQLQKEMGSRVLLLDAKSRDAQLGFVVGGFDTGRGLLVSKVLHGSWAEQKGLKEGDELTSLDGKDVKDLKEPEILEALQSQRPLKLGFLKPDPKLPAAAWPATAVPPASAIAAAAPAAPAEPGAEQEFWPASEKQAESLELLADESVEQLGLDLTGVPPSAVRIKQVLPDSWADAQAVHAGDELVKVNGQLTSSLSQQQIGLALRQTRPLRLTLARPTAALSGGRPSGARGSQGRPRESGKVLTFEAKEADERLGFKAGGKPPGEVCVDKLFPNLWAEKQGLRLKDVLEELNGQRLSEMQPEHLDQLIKTRPLTLVFRRRDGVGNDVATGSSAASGGLAAAGARLATAQKAVKPKAKAEPMAPSGPLKESVDLELPVGEKQLGFVPWGLPPARVMVRQVTGARAQKALLQVGHELVEVNEVHVRDIPRVELERTLLTRPLKLHFVASEASQGAFAVPAARDAEIEDEEVQAGILDLVATPDHDHLGFETTSSLNFNAVEVAKVEPGSWAMRMRIRMGDHLLSIDGTAVGSFAGSSLQEAIRSRARPMRLRFRRQGQNILDEDQRRLDVLATEADAELGFLMSGQPPSEVLVFKVIPGSWAAQRGLQEKDELVAVAGQPVSALSGAALIRYVQSVRPLRLRFHLAPGGPQPARAKPKAAPKVVEAAAPKDVPETKEAEASPAPKAKGRMGRAKLAQMLVGDMMKGTSQEEEVPSSPPAAPSEPAPPAAAPVQKPAAPAPKPAAPAPAASKPLAPAPKPKAAQAAPAPRPPARAVPPATAGRPSERAPATQDDSSSDDDAMIEKAAGTQDKDLGFEIAPRGTGAAMCFVVSSVKPGGWAQRQRIGVGNELLSIGGQVAKKMKLEDIQKMLAPDGVRPLRFWLQADMGS